MKKLISILLALTFVVSAMAFTASAAGEYYIFSFEQGLVNSSGILGSQYTNSCLTGRYQMTPNSTSLDIKAWAVAATGVKEVKYNFNDNGWVTLPETAFSARPDDIYNAETNTYPVLPVIGENVTVAPLKPEFKFSIPASELNMVLGSEYTFQVQLVTNANEEILIADLVIPYVEYSVSTDPQSWKTRGNCHVSLDGVAATLNGAPASAAVATSKVTYNPGKVDTINFFGWISVDQSADFENAFGYSVDDGEIVYGLFSAPTEDAVVVAGQYDYDSRFDIYAPVPTDLALGTHTVKFYCQLSNGEQIIMNTVTVEVTDVRNEVVPDGIKDGIDGFTASSICTFEYDQYVDGSDLTQSSSAFIGGSPFRAEWSPRPIAAAGMQVKVESVTDEATGTTTITNKYGSMWGINTHYSDHDWTGAYTFTTDIKVPDSTTNSRGIFVNFSGSEGVDGSGNPMIYEDWCTVGGYGITGKSGINVLFPDKDTMVVAVLTFDDAATENAQGAIYAVYNLPNTFDKFAKVEVTDDNNGNVFVSVNGNVISKVTYADAGMFANTYDQGYYKTATITDYNNGGVVASTDKALIWKYKTVGFGTRACELHMDNFQIVPAKDVTEPAVKVPAELTVNSGSLYTISGENLVIKAGAKAGENLDRFMSNIATNPAYVQITDANGAVKTSVTRFTTGYKVNILDVNGNVAKTYSVIILGDIDRNGRYAISDVSGVEMAVKLKPAKGTVEFLEANVDGNSRLALTDASALQMFLANGAWN